MSTVFASFQASKFILELLLWLPYEYGLWNKPFPLLGSPLDIYIYLSIYATIYPTIDILSIYVSAIIYNVPIIYHLSIHHLFYISSSNLFYVYHLCIHILFFLLEIRNKMDLYLYLIPLYYNQIFYLIKITNRVYRNRDWKW